MRRIARIGCSLLLILMLVMQCAFAGNVVSTVKLNQVQQNNAALKMYVSMTDANGNPSDGTYRADQFSISVDGKALDVDSVQKFDPTTTGIHYVFSVDVSKTLNDTMMKNIRNSMISFVDNMGPLDSVSIITFGENVTERIINSTDRAAIKSAINDLSANEGMTALYKGVIDAVNIAASVGGRSAVIVITDGKDDPTEDMKAYTKDGIYDSVKNAQVPLYCFGLNDKKGVDTQSLIELANVTGGAQYILESSSEMPDKLDGVIDIMRNAIVLNATLINADNKAGFDEISTFKVGYQPDNGGFITSNELQQNINWKNIPTPTPEPVVTPSPAISLDLDDTEIEYKDGSVTITGAVEVQQGSVDSDQLIIYVNGSAWRVSEWTSNGNEYIFSTKGSISNTTETLEIQAKIKDIGIASRVCRINIIQPTATPSPTPIPTATPAPVLTVSLDNSGREMLLEAGKTITISGVVEVEGTIDGDALKLYVNDQECEMNIRQINRSQYEFEADYLMDAQTPGEFKIQVKLDGTEIYSRAQNLYFVTPSPTPSPELYCSLNNASVVYEDGSSITISGSIEIVSGEVSPDDLAVYINNVKWNMSLETLSDTTYGFTAVGQLSNSDITQLDVKVRLLSDSKVVSNAEKMTVTTPEPTATPAPTARVEVTPPPTEVPTPEPATPTPEPLPEIVEEPGPDVPEDANFITASVITIKYHLGVMVENGTIWYLIIGSVLLLILIAGLIVLLRKRKKNNNQVRIDSVDSRASGFSTENRENRESPATTREDDGSPTERHGDTSRDFEDYNGSSYGGGSGTLRIDQAGGNMRLNEGSGGTARIEDEETAGVNVKFTEIRNNTFCNEHNMRIDCGSDIMLGREGGTADLRFDDITVSSRHLFFAYDGTEVTISDCGSTNGTKLNGKPITPNVPVKVESGDYIVIGKTTLKIEIVED